MSFGQIWYIDPTFKSYSLTFINLSKMQLCKRKTETGFSWIRMGSPLGPMTANIVPAFAIPLTSWRIFVFFTVTDRFLKTRSTARAFCPVTEKFFLKNMRSWWQLTDENLVKWLNIIIIATWRTQFWQRPIIGLLINNKSIPILT